MWKYSLIINVISVTIPQWICSYIFYPLALGLGIDVQDGQRVAELLGVKVFINEIIAYTTLGQYRKNRMKFEEYISHNFTEWSSNSETNDILLHGWNVTLQGGFLTVSSRIRFCSFNFSISFFRIFRTVFHINRGLKFNGIKNF